MALSGLGVVGAASTQAAPCRTATTLVLDPPKRSFGLPGGASVRIWDTGNRKQDILEARFVAVSIPKGSLIPRAETASTLSDKSTPQAQARSNPNAVVVINGAVFDPSGAATPRRAQITDAEIRKADSQADQGLALYEGSRTAEIASHYLSGSITGGLTPIGIGAWNWQSLSPEGVTVYTHEWGASNHPTASRTVVVKGGVVTEVIRHKKQGKKRPPKNTYYVTAPDGSPSSAALGLLTVGMPVQIETQEDGTLPFVAGKPTMGVPDSLIGVSSAVVRRSTNFASCGSRDNKLRPRSAIAWDAAGNMIVAAVSGRSNKNHMRSGGASVSQWAEYLLHLGAVNAVNLDGGTSTTLLVRRQIGGPLRRLDRDPKDSQARVADSLTFLAPTASEPAVVLSSKSYGSTETFARSSSDETPTDSGK